MSSLRSKSYAPHQGGYSGWFISYLVTRKSFKSIISILLVTGSQIPKLGWPVINPDNSPGLANSVLFSNFSF